MKFKVFIDESGETGIKKVRSESTPGASPYFALGAALVPEPLEDKLRKKLNELRKSINHLHCNKLKHFQKIHFAKEVTKEKILLFGLISRKETLGSYKEEIEDDDKKFYNKCSAYLLEIIGKFAEEKKIRRNDIKMVFEEGKFDYPALKNFVRTCQKNPIHDNAKYLQNINANYIFRKTKVEEDLLSIADLVAHSLYKCIDRNKAQFFITEPRYLKELSCKFHYDKENGLILGDGIKAIHKLSDLKLPKETESFLGQLKCQTE